VENTPAGGEKQAWKKRETPLQKKYMNREGEKEVCRRLLLRERWLCSRRVSRGVVFEKKGEASGIFVGESLVRGGSSLFWSRRKKSFHIAV